MEVLPTKYMKQPQRILRLPQKLLSCLKSFKTASKAFKDASKESEMAHNLKSVLNSLNSFWGIISICGCLKSLFDWTGSLKHNKGCLNLLRLWSILDRTAGKFIRFWKILLTPFEVTYYGSVNQRSVNFMHPWTLTRTRTRCSSSCSYRPGSEDPHWRYWKLFHFSHLLLKTHKGLM